MCTFKSALVIKVFPYESGGFLSSAPCRIPFSWFHYLLNAVVECVPSNHLCLKNCSTRITSGVSHLLPVGSSSWCEYLCSPWTQLCSLDAGFNTRVLINTYSPLCLRDNLSGPGCVCRQFFKARLHARIVSLCTFGNYE